MSEPSTGPRGWINRNNLGLLLLVVTVVICLIQVMRVQGELEPKDKITIRIAFWQLEAGYREAMQQMIDEYQKVRPDVRVIMMPVTEKVYAQWLNVHLIAGDAPDLCEMGMATLTNNDQYKVRYFTPLGEYVDEPNPYNKGTRLEGMPWRETFVDGMRGMFTESLQEYYAVPTSFFGTGLYYNKELLEDAVKRGNLNVPVPPQTFGDVIAVSAVLKAMGDIAAPVAGKMTNDELRYVLQIRGIAVQGGHNDLVNAVVKSNTGRRIAPLVSCYRVNEGGYLNEQYNVAFFAPLEEQLDLNLDGLISQDETYIGYLKGINRFDSPRVRTFMKTFKKLTEQFAEGFNAMDRQTATFKFVQGEAAMIITGSWDARSLTQSVASNPRPFTVGAMRYPVPGPDDTVEVDGKPQRLGEFVAGRMNNAGATGGAGYGIYKLSRHKEEALDFLKFVTSVKNNERFNRVSDWCPITIGAEPTELTKPFMPNPEGYTSRLQWDFSGDIKGVYEGQLSGFLSGEVSLDAFIQTMDSTLKSNIGGDVAWAKKYTNDRNAVRNEERGLAVQSTLALMAPPKEKTAASTPAGRPATGPATAPADAHISEQIVLPDPAEAADKHRRVLSQQVRKNNGHENAFRYRSVVGKELKPY